ncbi:TlpA disulfide reductase family protein [Pontibacter sp. SGAir0037]|uniref:TlpA disulfide reductase family protein n=1 Tax=Pontibacter sp. SGAir0037 TaxID=2571030 RepID=UPI00143CEAB5|nr:TlpA disulfide reductase family protein [Pontibacter sp. SGAir0037]
MEKIVIPSQKALETAKTDKERDSLRFAPSDELKRLVGCTMPDFTAQTLEGKSISRQSLKGKVVVMNFWFIGCKPCLAELPALNTLADQYKDKEVVFIAFGRDSQQRITEEFLTKHEFKFQHVADGKNYADKFLASAAGFPLSLVFDQNIAIRLFRWLYR